MFATMADLPKVSSLFTMKFHGFSETFKAVMFKPKGRRKDKEKSKDKDKEKDKDSARAPVPAHAPPTPPSPRDGQGASNKQFLEEWCLRQRVLDADFDSLVQLPPDVDLNEWLAFHTISFFHHVNLMYGVVAEFCTSESCPTLLGPDSVQRLCHDDKGKKGKQSAPQYIDHVMSHVQQSVNDESLFPTKYGQQFPPDFPEAVRRVHRSLLHVLAHLYHCHHPLLLSLGLQGHLNTLLTHFMALGTRFRLLPHRDAQVLVELHHALLNASAGAEQQQQEEEEEGEESAAMAAAAASCSRFLQGDEKGGGGGGRGGEWGVGVGVNVGRGRGGDHPGSTAPEEEGEKGPDTIRQESKDHQHLRQDPKDHQPLRGDPKHLPRQDDGPPDLPGTDRNHALLSLHHHHHHHQHHRFASQGSGDAHVNRAPASTSPSTPSSFSSPRSKVPSKG
ncbi:uncharacterized protein LOC143286976 [Babylonia areolata]|uniref:uncharacterized protein LOC143286976 n=1 Tax=Babylonia areolata TaxID=304850 RepID=UPI003FD692B1